MSDTNETASDIDDGGEDLFKLRIPKICKEHRKLVMGCHCSMLVDFPRWRNTEMERLLFPYTHMVRIRLTKEDIEEYNAEAEQLTKMLNDENVFDIDNSNPKFKSSTSSQYSKKRKFNDYEESFKNISAMDYNYNYNKDKGRAGPEAKKQKLDENPDDIAASLFDLEYEDISSDEDEYFTSDNEHDEEKQYKIYGITEEAICCFVKRKPVTPKEVLDKFRNKSTGASGHRFVKTMYKILKKYNPIKQMLRGQMYLWLK